MGDRKRFTGDLPRVDAATAADLVATGVTMAVSGFGSVGYPKATPTAIREADAEMG